MRKTLITLVLILTPLIGECKQPKKVFLPNRNDQFYKSERTGAGYFDKCESCDNKVGTGCYKTPCCYQWKVNNKYMITEDDGFTSQYMDYTCTMWSSATGETEECLEYEMQKVPNRPYYHNKCVKFKVYQGNPRILD